MLSQTYKSHFVRIQNKITETLNVCLYISASPNVPHRSKRSTELVTFINGYYDHRTAVGIPEGTHQGLRCHFTINGETASADVRCLQIDFKWARVAAGQFGQSPAEDLWHVRVSDEETIDEVASTLSSDYSVRLSSSPVDLDALNNEGLTLFFSPVLIEDGFQTYICNITCHTQSETLIDWNIVTVDAVVAAGKYKIHHLHCLQCYIPLTIYKHINE